MALAAAWAMDILNAYAVITTRVGFFFFDKILCVRSAVSTKRSRDLCHVTAFLSVSYRPCHSLQHVI